MTFENRQWLNNRFTKGTCAGILFCVLSTGCTVSPKTPAAAPQLQKAEQDCTSDCVDEHSDHRYQYYLGVLSVLLIS